MDQVDSKIKDMGVVLHDQGEEYKQPITPRSGSSKLLQGKVPREAKTRKSKKGQDASV